MEDDVEPAAATASNYEPAAATTSNHESSSSSSGNHEPSSSSVDWRKLPGSPDKKSLQSLLRGRTVGGALQSAPRLLYVDIGHDYDYNSASHASTSPDSATHRRADVDQHDGATKSTTRAFQRLSLRMEPWVADVQRAVEQSNIGLGLHTALPSVRWVFRPAVLAFSGQRQALVLADGPNWGRRLPEVRELVHQPKFRRAQKEVREHWHLL